MGFAFAIAGCLNVRGPININDLDKIVVNTRDIPLFQTLEQAIRHQQEVGGEIEEMLNVEGSDAPVAAQVSQSPYFRPRTSEAQGILAVHHHRFREWRIAGWSWGPG